MEPLVRLMEYAVSQNLLDYVRALREVAPYTVPEAISCGGGVAAFTGEGSPLTTVKGAGPDLEDEDIEMAVAFFELCGADHAMFEVAPWITPDSEARLRRHGFAPNGSEDVLVRRLPFDGGDSRHSVGEVGNAEWADLMIAANGVPATSLWTNLSHAAASLTGAVNLGVSDEGGWIACAQMVPVSGVAIFGNDATLMAARGRGAQRSLIEERLRRASAAGLSWAVAEVAPGSSSGRNYLRCGFRAVYTRTHYSRVIDQVQ